MLDDAFADNLEGLVLKDLKVLFRINLQYYCTFFHSFDSRARK